MLAPTITVVLDIASEKVELIAYSSLLPFGICLSQVSPLLWRIATTFSLSSQSVMEPLHICLLAGLAVPTTILLLFQIHNAVARCSFFRAFFHRVSAGLSLWKGAEPLRSPSPF